MTCLHAWRYSNDHFRWCGACGRCEYWLRRLGRSMGYWLTVGSVPIPAKRPARRKAAQ